MHIRCVLFPLWSGFETIVCNIVRGMHRVTNTPVCPLPIQRMPPSPPIAAAAATHRQTRNAFSKQLYFLFDVPYERQYFLMLCCAHTFFFFIFFKISVKACLIV